MSFSISSPVTGGPQTNFVSPTYTLVTDAAPTSAGKQYAVSAVGGTQAGVDTASSPSRPFTITGSRPQVLRSLSPVDPVTGVLRNVPRNTYKFIVRKGVTPLAGQSTQVMNMTLEMAIPAGADVADAPNVRAALSLLFGAFWAQSATIGDSLVTGII
jgi:hypothetical protein